MEASSPWGPAVQAQAAIFVIPPTAKGACPRPPSSPAGEPSSGQWSRLLVAPWPRLTSPGISGRVSGIAICANSSCATFSESQSRSKQTWAANVDSKRGQAGSLGLGRAPESSQTVKGPSWSPVWKELPAALTLAQWPGNQSAQKGAVCRLPWWEKENASSSPKVREAWSWRGFQRKVDVIQQEIKGDLKPSVRGSCMRVVTERMFLQQCIYYSTLIY